VNTNLLTALKQITAQYGEAALADPARLKAFFSDLAKDEPKPLRLAFGRSLEAGAYTALKDEPDAAERALRKTAIAHRVRDEHGLDPALSAEALDILEAALFGTVSAAGNDAKSWLYQGNAYYNKGDYDRAIADYTGALRIDPNYASAYNHRGNAYFFKGDYDRAIADYTGALRIDPNDASAYNHRGNAYFNKKDYDRAIADYTEVLRIDPNYAFAYHNRGNAYLKKKDYDRAIADCAEALRIDPNYADARVRLERAWKARGQ
jgi:tetratricopeptide (TPR) repeat protein